MKVLNGFGSKLADQNKARFLRSIIFFTFFYVYLWRYIQLHFMFHAAGSTERFPAFFKGWTFFHDLCTSPGGITEYAASFMAQLFYFSFAGATVITLIALLLCLSTDFIVRSFNAPTLRPLRFVPPIILLAIYAQYNQHIILNLALAITLLFVCLHIRITKKSKIFYLVFLLESTLLYYLAGGAFLIFTLLCALYEMFITQKINRAIICLLSAITIPYIIGTIISGVPAVHAFTRLTPFHWNAFDADTKLTGCLMHIMYLFVPAIAVLSQIQRLSENTNNQMFRNALRRYQNSVITKWCVQNLLLILLTIAVIFYFTDKRRKAAFELNYYFQHQKWTQLLEIAKQHPRDIISICYADIAMSKTARLGYDLLKWHRAPVSLVTMFPKGEMYNHTYWSKANAFLNVGFVNYAQHSVIRAMERCGRLPAILEQLAFLHMVKEDNDTAKVYLNALKKTLFHKDIADYYLNAIQDDPHLENIEQVQYYRKMINEDRIVFFDRERPNVILLEQINKNNNRIAFEYMMSMDLITKRPDMIVKNIPMLRKLGYKRMPRLYEEAVIIYEVTTKKKANLYGYSISAETRNNYKKFNDIRSAYAGNEPAMVAQYEKYFGDSYLFYHFKNN